jgi:CRISPR system Cascade subunit CasD
LYGKRDVLSEVAKFLDDPIWGVWLGRKTCIPTAPVLTKGDSIDWLFKTEQQALDKLLDGRPLAEFSHQREVERFEDGTDTFADQPLCFGGSTAEREFAPRRIKLVEARG